MTKARLGATLIVVILVAVPFVRGAEVVILKSSDAPAWRPALDALRRAAGSHTVVEIDLKADQAEAARVVAQLKGRGAVLVAMGPLAALAARQGLPEAPLVFSMIQDPTRLGLVVEPGVTGVTYAIPVMNQLAAFRSVNPRGTRIGVIYQEEASGALVREAQKAARVLRLALHPTPVLSERDVPQALRGLLSGDGAVDALWVPPDPLLLGDETRRYLLSETLKAGKPIYAFSASLVSEGALVSDSPEMTSIGEQAGELVNQLAAGDKGKIETAVPRAELVVNKKIAGKLKIEIPDSIKYRDVSSR
jgi:putative tryptophan/tyrosine transport system substrate-binding protein